MNRQEWTTLVILLILVADYYDFIPGLCALLVPARPFCPGARSDADVRVVADEELLAGGVGIEADIGGPGKFPLADPGHQL